MMEEEIKKILVADDDLNYADYAKSALADAGFLPDSAKDGDEVIEKTVKQKYDLILLDLIMPVKNGFEVLETLRMAGDNTPVIAFATTIDEAERKKVLFSGASGYYLKPNGNIEELVEIVKIFFTDNKIQK